MNINPRQMQKMMQRLGMQQREIDASEVIIRTTNKDIIFKNPNVSKVNAMGQETWQIIGHSQEQVREAFSNEDERTVMEQTGVEKAVAHAALVETKGDLAEAILKLKR